MHIVYNVIPSLKICKTDRSSASASLAPRTTHFCIGFQSWTSFQSVPQLCNWNTFIVWSLKVFSPMDLLTENIFIFYRNQGTFISPHMVLTCSFPSFFLFSFKSWRKCDVHRQCGCGWLWGSFPQQDTLVIVLLFESCLLSDSIYLV